MEDLLATVAKQAPSLAVLALVVWMFVRRQREAAQSLDRLAEQCHAVQLQAIAAMREVAHAMGGHNEQQDKIYRRLGDVADSIAHLTTRINQIA